MYFESAHLYTISSSKTNWRYPNLSASSTSREIEASKEGKEELHNSGSYGGPNHCGHFKLINFGCNE